MIVQLAYFTKNNKLKTLVTSQTLNVLTILCIKGVCIVLSRALIVYHCVSVTALRMTQT